ncbi:MAG TPA: hypothetical protein VGF85_10180 [Opitutaceae bacterium]
MKSLFAGWALAAGALAGADEIQVGPPAHNWVLPLFTKEGYRQMTLRGDRVQPVTSDRVDITGMTVTVYSGDAKAKVDSFLSSPEATFLINEKVAKGPGSVRIVRDDVEVEGEAWTYLYNERKVLIARNVHVLFHAAMPDLLK